MKTAPKAAPSIDAAHGTRNADPRSHTAQRASNMRSVIRTTPATITVHVPLTFTTRGGAKRIVSEFTGTAMPSRFESAPIKAIARAHRWRKLIESGEYASITELAKTEKVNQSYACRLLRLTLLSPDIINAILDGRLNPVPRVGTLMKPMPAVWAEQCRCFGC